MKKRVIGADKLRRGLTEILNSLPKRGGEIVITQYGKPQAVMIDLESYIELQERLLDSDPRLIKEINEAVADVKAGNGIPAEKVFKDLGLD